MTQCTDSHSVLWTARRWNYVPRRLILLRVYCYATWQHVPVSWSAGSDAHLNVHRVRTMIMADSQAGYTFSVADVVQGHHGYKESLDPCHW